ncbi:MAG: DNRLRE domain-containing protein, partial [Chloroflexota bacterium]|nr:DNRLRE domain-containing protein [Chloroflexota bacterium]
LGPYVTSAKLRLYVADPSDDGGRIYSVSNSWTETGITWSNAPAISGTALASATAPTAGAWVEFDLGSVITADGTYSFALVSGSTDTVAYSSREEGHQPELVIGQTGSAWVRPTANFAVSLATGTAPLTVRFADTSSSTPSSWAWDFQSDGTVDSIAQNATFIYRSSGTYSVKLTVANPAGTDSELKLSLMVVDPGPPSASGDPVLVGAGDIASCTSTGDQATAALLDAIPGTVFTAGDNAYESGSATEFANCYDPTWGRHKARTRPAVGNHEYNTSRASGYYNYFGAAAGDPSRGYYSYNVGAWHVVVLNSNCAAVGGCGAGSPQETWLRRDLAANTSLCTLAYWHHPLFSSGEHGNNPIVKPLWDALQADGAELVVAGHDHSYERFEPQRSDGVRDPNGLREIVVGTGGRSIYAFPTIRANSVVRDRSTFGVLKLTLHSTGYTWEFVGVAGSTGFADAGSSVCH